MHTAAIFLSTAIGLAGASARADQNLVEPLSNGLTLSMTAEDIQKTFGAPVETQWGGKTFVYKDFTVLCGAPRDGIWRLELKEGVKLSSGVAPGASLADVKRVFGSELSVVNGQYQLTFNYDRSGHVSGIIIQPANGPFTTLDAPPAPAVPGVPALIGKWVGNNGHTLDLYPDGTYKYGLLATGKWRVEKDVAVFDGPLSDWDGGRAKGKDGHLEFTVKDESGPHASVFVKQ